MLLNYLLAVSLFRYNLQLIIYLTKSVVHLSILFRFCLSLKIHML